MKRKTQGVITAIRQFVAGADGPVALLELTDVASGYVTRRMVQLSTTGETLSLEPAPPGFATPDRPGTGSFGSVGAAGMAFASVAVAARAIAAQLLLVAPDGIIEIATDGDQVFALEAEPDMHDGTRQRIHHLRIIGPRAEVARAPDLAPLRLTTRRSLTGLAVSDGRLLAMVADPMAGLDIFALTLSDPDAGFRPLLERGGERYMLNAAVSAVAAGPGGVLVGTAALADANLRVGNWGPELVLLPPDGGWDLVIGQPRLTPQGLQIPASGLMPGLGQAGNAAIKAIATGPLGGGTGTWIAVQRFAARPVADRRTARPDMFAYRGAARLYVSADLVDWRAVSMALPEGVGAITALHVTPRAVLIGHEGAGMGAVPMTVIPRKDRDY
jgi:hypothetical protein